MAWGFDLPAIDDHSDHLVAWWDLEETGAADRVDAVGSNDLTAYNTPATRVGVDGNACDFDSGSGEYLAITDNSDLSPTTGLAISMWVYMDDASANDRPLFSKSQIGSANYYGIRNQTLGGYRFNIVQSDTTAKILSPVTLPISGWRHVVSMACDGFLRVFVDNIEHGSTTAYDNTILNEAAPFNLGKEPWGGFTHDGGIDAVGFWKDISFASTAEREAFVAGLWNSSSGRFYHEIVEVRGPIQHGRFARSIGGAD
jgi:hypothetical protein